MHDQNIIVKLLMKPLCKCFSILNSFFSSSTFNDTHKTPKAFLKHSYFKLSFASLSISLIYLLLIGSTIATLFITTIILQKELNVNRTKPNAFIITGKCNSERYNATKENIQRALPNFFNIICFPSVPLQDRRVHPLNVTLWKKLSSNLLAFLDIWMYEIPKYSRHNQLEWTFIFEDDVNFVDLPVREASNLTESLQKIMNNPDVQIKDGFLYLGICGPTYSNNAQPLLLKNKNITVVSRKGHGYCLHASAITEKRSKLFWTEISSYRPNPSDLSLDYQLRHYSIRSNSSFHILGTNFEYPPGTGHFGIAYQDRGRFWSTVT